MESFDFEQELITLQGKLRNYAYLLFPQKEDAEDLLQETLLKALENRERYNENVNFKGWLYTIMHNTFVNICKSKKYCLFLSMSDGNLDADIARTMEDFATDELSFEEVAQIVDELPENLRVVLSMRLKGFKYFEIAAHTGMPLGLVKSRIFYGKKRLKEILSSF
ncbi:RNA polymerase sigma factor [Phocaeicola fibrisolvens]|jgi:RNA polymerase sigma-70 factor (ECF subfamily)|uniref:RNA polymerase sigma factor n=1 Tax=Phocaeicola fibrisolvens TaxID=2981793 RepID=UPI0008206A88|nr:RNA polymerase sigma factor [Phocaeicola fibrisolvens]MBM6656585.1 RNA polymerase sigma factor [Bacteroides mediterraneensis]MBU3834209.1 RNA polymerase sigma factor [Candidatus Phocaeicola merdigallinarum]MCU6780016.1 RNA polymerase sigma factor [Phocaeicola fibrisolvens]SCI64205.1 Sigma-24 [uncultured Bacteroides sp.]